MKILLVTGKIAEREVRKIAEKYDCDVYVADVDVASFITPKHLENLDLSRYDIVIVPGLASGDWKRLEDEKGVKIRLGTIHYADLPLLLENIDKIELSHEIPACKLLNINKAEENMRLVDSLDKCYFHIGDVRIGGRMKIVAEIVDATKLDNDSLIAKIEYYLKSGADIIDLGIPLEFDSRDVERVVKVARDCCDALSIDTFNRKAVEIGVKYGVDMIMSVSNENLDCLELAKDKAVVVVDRNVNNLLKLVEKAKKYTEKIIADPLLDPLDVFSSLMRYYEFRKRCSIPLLMGVGNVTELMDADSIGINALLAYIAEEIGCQILFTTEASDKTRGSIRELKVATYMAKVSKLKRVPPKDLGFDLLVFKEKRIRRNKCEAGNIVEAKPSEFTRDPMGDFRIWIDDRIYCQHEKATVVGDKAKDILDTIIRLGLVSRLDHAGYLGRELKKAEMALKLGKSYVQDEELNFGIYSKEFSTDHTKRQKD
ncbi:dihydropteroate synthase-like protein [Archaeoglobus profundus]|uniref:Dihydropteroate synthase-related protein n=1 Tax=Archaeoglobus profundus (strain DSM 5631 / JCM 9629 / NBRC 100127 / Av18) TaxID=572546 RepID=D2RGK5_ARCPA|nr:dihydropteroate synthase-like protein [Archaeoglobus profundus]ADB57430.1 dihydropteroate synthase-related protein [Archaeoglobus profundus DSM 5631]